MRDRNFSVVYYARINTHKGNDNHSQLTIFDVNSLDCRTN